MLRVVAALLALFSGAGASDWACDSDADDKDLGVECVDVVDLFMHEVLELPKTSAGRRLLVVDGSEVMVRGDTPGKQIGFLVDLINHGNQTDSGWRLPPGRRLHSAAGEAVAGLMDDMMNENNNGVKDGKHSRRNAMKNKWKKAKKAVKKGMSSEHKAKNSNHNLVQKIKKHVPSAHWKKKMIKFFKGQRVLGVIGKNSKILYKDHGLVLDYQLPLIIGLTKMATALFSQMAMYEQRALQKVTVTPVRTLSSVPRMQAFSLMAAGMITLSAAIVAGSRHWSKWRASADSGEAKNHVMVDVE